MAGREERGTEREREGERERETRERETRVRKIRERESVSERSERSCEGGCKSGALDIEIEVDGSTRGKRAPRQSCLRSAGV